MNFYESAIEKIYQARDGRGSIYLNSYEYSELMKRASVAGSYGSAARNALLIAKRLDYRPFALISGRDRVKEDEYAGMGVDHSSGCFLTTACMEHMREDFDDNCRELTVLRRYRDSWLREHHPEDIELYYHVAPMLVEEVDSREDSREVWLSLYEDSILPAVRAAEAGEDEEAYRIYRAMVEDLLDRFAPLPF